MFDDSKVKYNVELRTGPDVHLNNDNNAAGEWTEIRVVARYDGIEDVRGEDRICLYSRIGEGVNWVGKYLDLLRNTARLALYAQLTGVADRVGLDVLIDPYDGDPRNEIADLADWFDFATDGINEIYAGYVGEGLAMTVSGTVERVLAVLRAANGRGAT